MAEETKVMDPAAENQVDDVSAQVVQVPTTGPMAVLYRLTGGQSLRQVLPAVAGITVAVIGLVFFAIGAWLMSYSDVNTPFWTFAFFGCVSQLGLAFLMPSLSVAALSALPSSQLYRGSGNVNFIRQLGGAVGTNLGVVWIQLRTAMHGDVLVSTQTAANHTTREFLAGVRDRLAGAVPGEVTDAVALEYLGRVIEAQALTLGFKDAFLALAVVFIVALVPAWVFARTR